jgi:sterol desaturase/sphingolipid hydroxylase (fatty acid hydroxylase superfamily)
VSNLTINDYWLTLLVSTILPIIVALVTKQQAKPAVKAFVLLLHSAISGWLTSLYATGGTFDPKSALLAIILGFVTATATHFGLLRPTKITGTDGAVASKTVHVGIG